MFEGKSIKTIWQSRNFWFTVVISSTSNVPMKCDLAILWRNKCIKASQITRKLTVCSAASKPTTGEYQCPAFLTLCGGIHRWSVASSHQVPVMSKLASKFCRHQNNFDTNTHTALTKQSLCAIWITCVTRTCEILKPSAPDSYTDS